MTFADEPKTGFIPAKKVEALDTTGAGDCFVGWLGVGIGEGLRLEEAVKRACHAASIGVTRFWYTGRDAISTQGDCWPIIMAES